METKKNNVKKQQKERTKDLIFVLCVLAIPMLCFAVFYVGTNVNSIFLAFKKYTVQNTANGVVANYEWVGFYNIAEFFKQTFVGNKAIILKNSLIIYGFNFLFGLPLALLFSFYIYKKRFGSGVFSVVLFLPSILSSIVMTILFQYFVELAVPSMVAEWFGENRFSLFGEGIEAKWKMIVFYNVWVGFGLGVIMYSNAMSRIPEEIVESAQLDGISTLKEFIYITLPLIFPTVSTFIVTGVAGIFIDQANIQGFYGTGTGAVIDVQTIGYHIFQSIMVDSTNYAAYPPAAAAGVSLTLISAPIVIFVRWALDKFGPTTEF